MLSSTEKEMIKSPKDFTENLELLSFLPTEHQQILTGITVKLSCLENLRIAFKRETRKNYLMGAVPSFIISWLAFPRSDLFKRFTYAAGAAQVGGEINAKRLEDYSTLRLMELDMAQKDLLSDVVVKEYYDNPRTRPIISKHLYSEKVFDESDQLKERWRSRYFSGNDDVFSGVNYSNFLVRMGVEVEENSEPKELSRIPDIDEVADPFGHVFGISENCEDN